MAGTVSDRSRDEVVKFGQQFAIHFGQLNDTCRRFFSYINGRIFTSMQEWRSVLSVFKNSVLETAWGSRSEKQAIYQQIENFLLDPTNQKVVAINPGKKGRTGSDVSHYLMHLLTDASISLSAQCVVCKSTAGIIVKCSKQRCTKTFHTFCAAAVTHCKHPPSDYYRCREHAEQFAAVEVTTTKKKRSSQGKPPTKNGKKNRVATANEQRSEDKTSATNPATPDGNRDQASAGIAGADANPDADSDPGSDSSLSSFASDNAGGSVSEEGQIEGCFNMKDGSAMNGSTSGLAFDPIIEEACDQLFWIRNDLSSAQDALLEASQDSFKSVVSLQTAERIRTVLGTIRHGLATLSNLAGSLGARKSGFPLVPAVDCGLW
jgi:hypothetical protein